MWMIWSAHSEPQQNLNHNTSKPFELNSPNFHTAAPFCLYVACAMSVYVSGSDHCFDNSEGSLSNSVQCNLSFHD